MKQDLLASIDAVRVQSNCVDGVDDALFDWLVNEGADCRRWTDAPATHHPPHDHPYSHRVLAVSGWIEFTLSGDTYRLTPGDALDIPKHVEHEATTAPEKNTEYWLIQPT